MLYETQVETDDKGHSFWQPSLYSLWKTFQEYEYQITFCYNLSESFYKNRIHKVVILLGNRRPVVIIVYRVLGEKFIHFLKFYMAHSGLLAILQTHGMGNFLEDLGLLFCLEGSPMADFLSPFTSLLKCHLLKWSLYL